ncbi:MAG: SpoIIE family protein phosphatase [Bacteroidia bacterium]
MLLNQLCYYCEISDNLKYANQTLDLINKLKITTPDSVTKRKLFQLEASSYGYIGVYYSADNYYNSNVNYNPNKAVFYFNKSLNIYKRLNSWEEINTVYSSLESVYLKTGNTYNQLQNYKNALAFGKLANNNIFTARYNYRIANFYARVGDTIKAIQYANNGIELEKQINDPKRLAKGYQLGADLYFKLKNYKKAINFYYASLAEYKTNMDTVQKSLVYLGLGNTYRGLNDNSSALLNYNKALRIAQLDSNEVLELEVLMEIGRLEYQFKKYNEAIKYFEIINTRASKIGFPGGIAVSNLELAKSYVKIKDYNKAKAYSNKSLLIVKKIASQEQIMAGERLCYQIDSAMGDYKNALFHFQNYMLSKQIINTEEIKKASQKEDLEIQFKFEKEKEAKIQESKELKTASEFKLQKTIRNFLFLGIALLSVVVAFVIRNLIIKKKFNQGLLLKNNEINKQKHIIEEKHKEITDSFNYAERIQRSFLATKKHLDENLNLLSVRAKSRTETVSVSTSLDATFDNYFILFKPKDVVSGDFYWSANTVSSSLPSRQTGGVENFVIATADSTGHGVPGAIMSLLNITSLEKAIETETTPDKILNTTRKIIIDRLKKDGSEEGGKDGMDCSLLTFDFKNLKLQIAAANNPVWIVRPTVAGVLEANDNTFKNFNSTFSIYEVKPDKMPVGKHDKQDVPFTLHEVNLQKGDVIYTLTDGFPDQFGGEKGKKYMIKNLRELIISIAHLPMHEQKQILENTFNNWKGTNEQVDDVSVIGIRV